MKHIYTGKVRDIYEVDDEHLLFVTSDRISAFDVVMTEPIPGKGRVLTALTAFWAGQLADVAPTHLVSLGLPPNLDAPNVGAANVGADTVVASGADVSPGGIDPGFAAGRTMVVRRAEMLPIECIVRGYLSGSAWAEYRRSGTMHGEPLPAGLAQSEKLPEPVFTPSTKATVGHDENISFEDAARLVGDKLASAAREISLEAYRAGAERAAERGIIIADTKFELGLIDGELAICDEILTPDSSRFWPADLWQPGAAPPSFDKQPLRDWLEATGWGKTPPPPALPPDVVAATRARYVEAYERLSGLSFADWPGTDK
jgi:phosphoribosylaminoimidazole-succinocarboxamide synthase